MLLRIGEFARLTGLPVSTIRYYSEVGLLPPASVDTDTGYRRYHVEQVDVVSRLGALKACGLSLMEIRLVLNDQLDDRVFRDLLRAKVAELRTESDRVAEQLQRAQAQLQLLEQRLERPMAEVTIKQTDSVRIAYIREQIGGVAEIGPLFPRLFENVDFASGTGPAANIYHHFSEDGNSIDVEAALPIPDGYQPHGPVQTRVIEATEVASLMHHGAFNRLHEAHAELLAWVDANGYQVAGPAYEWNIVCTEPVTQDNESYVTEVQVEVQAKP